MQPSQRLWRATPIYGSRCNCADHLLQKDSTVEQGPCGRQIANNNQRSIHARTRIKLSKHIHHLPPPFVALNIPKLTLEEVPIHSMHHAACS